MKTSATGGASPLDAKTDPKLSSRMRQMTALCADWWNDSGVPDELG